MYWQQTDSRLTHSWFLGTFLIICFKVVYSFCCLVQVSSVAHRSVELGKAHIRWLMISWHMKLSRMDHVLNLRSIFYSYESDYFDIVPRWQLWFFQLFLSNDEWDDGYGGFCSFIAEDEEEEVNLNLLRKIIHVWKSQNLFQTSICRIFSRFFQWWLQVLRVSPVANGAALVFREPDVFPFIKYVNCRAENRNYFVVSCSFYGMAIENDDESTDDEELEESAGDNES